MAHSCPYCSDKARVMYVLFELAPRIDTVAILTCQEVDALIVRARSGEFDDDIRRVAA